MPQVIEKAVTQALALVRAGDQTGYVEQLNRHRAGSVVTHAIIGLASFSKGLVADVWDAGSRAGAWDLEISYGLVGVDGSESEAISDLRQDRRGRRRGAIRKVAWSRGQRKEGRE